MKQVAQNFKTGVISVEDVPQPVLRPGSALVRNEWSVVSAGTEKSKVDLGRKSLIGKAQARPDLVRQVVGMARAQGIGATIDTVRGRLDSLTPLGYSCAGTVIAVAPDVVGLEVGARVACAGGEHAHHAGVVCVPRNMCAVLPDDVSTEQGAYATIGAIAMHGVRQADVRVGERVLVIGLGLLGQIAVQLLKAAGCQVAGADVSARQLALAETSGCDLAVDASAESAESQLIAWTSDAGFDAIVITAATKDNAPFLLAAAVARDRARIVLVGDVRMDLPRAPLYEKELSIVLSRSYGPGRYDPEYEEHGHDYPIGYVRWTEQRNMEAFLHMVATGSVRLDHLTTHRFDVDDAPKAYDLLATGSEPYAGILLRYPHRPGEPPSRAAERASGTGRRGVELIGAGSFATRVLVPALKASGQLELDAVVSAHGLSAVDMAKKAGFRAAESDPEVAFGRPGAGAAVIATRHDSHARLAEAAMRAGLDVFVEKPLCIAAEDLAPLVAAQSETGRVCMVGFNRRFAPATRVLQEVRRATSRPVQCLIRVNAGRIPSTHWIQDPAIGGGRIVGEACHFVDLAAAIVGSPVTRVSATALGAAASAETADSLSVHLTHADGSISTVVYTAEGDPRLPKEHVELFADGAAALIEDFREAKTFRGGKLSVARTRGVDKGHNAEIAAFSRAVATSSSVEELSFDECVDSTVATFAVVESLRTGLPVEIASYRSALLGHG